MNGLVVLPRPVGRALLASCFGFLFASAAVAENWQWRINKLDDGKLLLAFTEMEATDDLSGMSFYCEPSSGRIEVRGATNKLQRQVFADLIRSGSYPTLELEQEKATWDLSHSDVDGWEFRFEIAADGAAFEKFRNTGQFGFTVGTLAVDNSIRKAGLDKISKFQAACRLPADKVTPRPKAPESPFPDPHAAPLIGKP